jgi:hypothetical protein
VTQKPSDTKDAHGLTPAEVLTRTAEVRARGKDDPTLERLLAALRRVERGDLVQVVVEAADAKALMTFVRSMRSRHERDLTRNAEVRDELRLDVKRWIAQGEELLKRL